MNRLCVFQLLCSLILIGPSFAAPAQEDEEMQIVVDNEKYGQPENEEAILPEEWMNEQACSCEKCKKSKLGAQRAEALLALMDKSAKASAFVPSSCRIVHFGACHALKFCDIFGQMIKLEDDSVWAIRQGDGLENWATADHNIVNEVAIAINHEWWSFYPFRLYNFATGKSVAAKLKVFALAPFHNSLNHRLVAFEESTKIIWLEDGSAWSILPPDYSSRWATSGHTIIIGTNDGAHAIFKPYILINANLNHVVRAACLGG